jgi:hypothetical protein
VQQCTGATRLLGRGRVVDCRCERASGTSVGGQGVRVPAGEERRAGRERLGDLLRMGRLPEAWIAPPATRELRELVRHRAKLVGIRSHCKAEIHAVLAKCAVQVLMSDLFGLEGAALLDDLRRDGRLPAPYSARVTGAPGRRSPAPGCRAARRPRCRCGSGRRTLSGRPARRSGPPSGCGTRRRRRTASWRPRRGAGPQHCADRPGTGSPAPAAAR